MGHAKMVGNALELIPGISISSFPAGGHGLWERAEQRARQGADVMRPRAVTTTH
jgi:hypothetical protein